VRADESSEGVDITLAADITDRVSRIYVYFTTSHSARPAGHYVVSLVSVFRPPKASSASAHCLPAPVCAHIACLVPCAKSVCSGTWPAGPKGNELTKNAPTHAHEFLAPKTIHGHPGATVKIWKQSPLPFTSYKRTNTHYRAAPVRYTVVTLQ